MSSSRKTKWFNSMFGDEDDDISFNDELQSIKKPRISSRTKGPVKYIVHNRATPSELSIASSSKALPSLINSLDLNSKSFNPLSANWIDNFEPKIVSDLAINSKKVDEIINWLKCYEKNKVKCPAKILLITGPPGCGKTTVIKVIAKENEYNINEWISPTDSEFISNLDDGNHLRQIPYESQLDKFTHFLLVSSRYKSVFDNFDKRLILVEDFPNILISDPDVLKDIVERYLNIGKAPLIFCVTDTKSKQLNIAYNLFPETFRMEYKIDQISLNAVSTTLLTKGLKRMCNIMQLPPMIEYYNVPSQDVIDSIILTSQGDIRNAIINLHFSTQKDSTRLPTEQIVTSKDGKAKSKRNKKKKFKTIGCDENLTLMHALGRVFNPKYTESSSVKDYKKLLHSPEDITDSFLSQPMNVISLLHTNYLTHFTNIEDVADATTILCVSDILSNEYRDTNLSEISLNLTVRGLMVLNQCPATGWIPIKGQKKYTKDIRHFEEMKKFGLDTNISSNIMAIDFRTYLNKIKSNAVK